MSQTSLGIGAETPSCRPVAGDSGDLAHELLHRLRDLAPEAVAGDKVDLSALADLLGETAEVDDERYLFSWHGRREAIRQALMPSHGTLVPAPDLPGHTDASENAFIEGDNLEVLKILRRAYSERVKLIYIDPPYNRKSTSGDLIYADDSSEPLEDYLRKTGQTSDTGQLLVANPDTSGRYHDRWLSSMYPRLRLARTLLREDGVLICAIGEEEVHHVRLLLDSVFGPDNFICTMVWEGGRKNDAHFVSVGQDYMLVYARNKACLEDRGVRWRVAKPGVRAIIEEAKRLLAIHGDDYEAATREFREFLKPLGGQVKRLAEAARLVAEAYPRIAAAFPELARPVTELPGARYKDIDGRGAYCADGDLGWPGGGGNTYDVLHPLTGEPVKRPSGGWRHSESEMQRLIAEDRIAFKADEKGIPRRKLYLEETETEAPSSVFYRTGTLATEGLERLMGGDVFDHPKDPEILAELIEATTSGDDLILDFFAGSGSTGEAVLRQNHADGGRRRFILVQLPEDLEEAARKPGKDGQTARNALALKHKTLSQLSADRVRRVGDEMRASGDQHEGEDLGFRAFCLGEAAYRPDGTLDRAGEVSAEEALGEMHRAGKTLRDGVSDRDLLVEVMLREGFSLTARVESEEVASHALHRITEARGGSEQVLLVCLDKGLGKPIDKETGQPILLGELTSRLPPDAITTVIVRDQAANDDLLVNLGLRCAERSNCYLKTL